MQHIWGVDTSIRDVVRRYAKQGYVTIAPALYSRWNPPTGDGTSNIDTFRPFANRMTEAQSDGDLSAGAAWIRQRAGFGMNDHALKVGVTGFCAGAGIALRQVIDTPWYDALGMFYGNVLQRSDPTKGISQRAGTISPRFAFRSSAASAVAIRARAFSPPRSSRLRRP